MLTKRTARPWLSAWRANARRAPPGRTTTPMNDRFRPPANALGPVWADAQEQALRQAFFDEAADNLAHFEQLLLGEGRRGGGQQQGDQGAAHDVLRKMLQF